MLVADLDVLGTLEAALREYLPAPEREICAISAAVAFAMPGTEEGARLRRLAFDLDHLLVEARWHIGQALLLMRLEPDAVKAPAIQDEWDEVQAKFGMPASALLLIRQLASNADRVYYSDLGERRGGGTVAAWILHMLTDSAIFRIVAALDRVAHLAWLALQMPLVANGREIRVYFRSGKIREINNKSPTPESAQLLQLACDPFTEMLIRYRDGLSHNVKLYSRAAGAIPTDEWIDKTGNPVIQTAEQLTADLLLGLAVSAYVHASKTLTPLSEILTRRFPEAPQQSNAV